MNEAAKIINVQFSIYYGYKIYTVIFKPTDQNNYSAELWDEGNNTNRRIITDLCNYNNAVKIICEYSQFKNPKTKKNELRNYRSARKK